MIDTAVLAPAVYNLITRTILLRPGFGPVGMRWISMGHGRGDADNPSQYRNTKCLHGLPLVAFVPIRIERLRDDA